MPESEFLGREKWCVVDGMYICKYAGVIYADLISTLCLVAMNLLHSGFESLSQLLPFYSVSIHQNLHGLNDERIFGA